MRILLCCIIFLKAIVTQAQDLSGLEAQLIGLQKVLSEGETEEKRLESSRQIAELFKENSTVEGFFEYPFYKLTKIGVLESGDDEFKLINWNVPIDADKFTYRALVIFPDGNYVELLDSIDLDKKLETKQLSPSEWYGALYYEIHPVKTRKRKYYTLVGWDGNNSLSNKKVLDALVIDKKNNVQLGLDVFQDGDLYKRRRVFEYSDKVVMTLRYIKPKQALIFDVLEPLQAGLEGQYQFYGPSTMYSGYSLEKDGTWRLEEVMDMSRPKDAENGAQFNFPDRPDIDRQRKKVNPLTGQ